MIRRVLSNRTYYNIIRRLISTDERLKYNIPLEVLNEKEVNELCTTLKNSDDKNHLDLFKNRIQPGVDTTSNIKASFLNEIAKGNIETKLIDKKKSVYLLGTMQGGYNVEPLINLLTDKELGKLASETLSDTILIFDYFHDVVSKADNGCENSLNTIKNWANATWFTNKKKVPEKITVVVFKVSGETNTDDLSPAQDAWSRPDIPLHSLSMLKMEREGIIPDDSGTIGPLKQIKELKEIGHPIAYVGDIVGTGSSRKSATNSILWHFGDDIPYVPNKRTGGVCIGGKIAPIFFNTMEDSGSFPMEMPVDDLKTGDIIDIYPYEGVTKKHNSNEIICEWSVKNDVIFDSVQAGGRINLIIGKSLTNKAREYLKLPPGDLFRKNTEVKYEGVGYTLAQKIVGNACDVEGVHPGNYCEPKITTVGSQDTTGPMTRDELKDLACLGFSCDYVLQSFCHTAAYPKPVDVVTHKTLPQFINTRGGVSLKPGDGIIHSWLNRMLIPDTVGTGGDSHTRFPIGISFPAGSGLVAFAATSGVMPLDMPESVLVRFVGKMQKGVTLRDLVHAIPYFAKKEGMLTIEKKGKVNVFNGRILEIEGLEDLTCEQAFELSDASAERSSAGCTIKLSKESIAEYLESNIALLSWMISEGYEDKNSINRRIVQMKKWLENRDLLEADKNASYAYELIINMDDIKEPILCAPNDPDDARLLSEVSGENIDEVFIGSCMTNIGHFRAAGKILDMHKGEIPSKLWISPPTKMDEAKLTDEGFYETYKKLGVRTEIPGCSLCMGNQARVEDNATVLSTSTRNFPNRLGKGANVYLASAELSVITAIEGNIPSVDTYMNYYKSIDDNKGDIYNYLDFSERESV